MKTYLSLASPLLVLACVTVAAAQTLLTDEPAPQKLWEVLLKLAFPVLMTAVGPFVTGFIQNAPAPIKYVIAGLSSMFLGALAGSIPDFPLTPESAATIGVTSGVTGQALMAGMLKRDPAPAKS